MREEQQLRRKAKVNAAREAGLQLQYAYNASWECLQAELLALRARGIYSAEQPDEPCMQDAEAKKSPTVAHGGAHSG